MKLADLKHFCFLVVLHLVECSSILPTNVNIKVFHYILDQWRDSRSFHSGDFSCSRNIKCEWSMSNELGTLRKELHTSQRRSSKDLPLVTVGLHNIHSVWEKYKDFRPQVCMLPTNITMWETEEPAYEAYKPLFNKAETVFDGYSSTSPNASVQRIYNDAKLNETSFLPLRPFSKFIKAGAYIASDCHVSDGANSQRDQLVQTMRNLGFRVDGLGRCMHTNQTPEGFYLKKPTNDTAFDLQEKRKVIKHYAFTMAFENMVEEGYVSEKPFDALLAGKKIKKHFSINSYC
jgi:hypothetical protein